MFKSMKIRHKGQQSFMIAMHDCLYIMKISSRMMAKKSILGFRLLSLYRDQDSEIDPPKEYSQVTNMEENEEFIQ